MESVTWLLLVGHTTGAYISAITWPATTVFSGCNSLQRDREEPVEAAHRQRHRHRHRKRARNRTHPFSMAAAAAAYPCLTLAAAATKAHPSKEADIRARLVTTTMRHRWSLCCPTASTPPRLPAPQLHCANTRLPTSCTSSTLALCFLATGSDLNADPERFTSTDEYSSSLPYAGGKCTYINVSI